VAVNKPDHLKFSLRSFSNDEIDEILEKSTNFRDINYGWVSNLAEQMRSDQWESGTGEALAFDDKERLINGQHRLSAAKVYQEETGSKAWFWCAYGCAAAVAMKCDNTAPRRLGDFLKHSGIPFAPICVSLIFTQAITVMRSKTARSDPTHIGHLLVGAGSWTRGPKSDTHKKGKQYRIQPSLSLLIDQWKRHRGAIEFWASEGSALKHKLGYGILLAVCCYQFAKVDETDAKLFASYLKDGSGLKKNDPIYLLRERMIAMKTSVNRLSRLSMAALVVKAWVAWCEDRELGYLRWAQFGDKAEDFPSHVPNKEAVSAS
jgi:hypothetical protein